MAQFQIITFVVVSVVRKSCPLKEIHVYSLVIQTMRKCNRTAFLRSVFVWLLQLLTQKVKLFEPNKTIVFVISQIAVGGWIMFSFFSVQKSSDRIKWHRTTLDPNQTGQFVLRAEREPCSSEKEAQKQNHLLTNCEKHKPKEETLATWWLHYLSALAKSWT